MRSDKDFEEHFPALTHASEEKRAQAPGQIMAIRRNQVLKSRFITTYKLPFKKEKVVLNKYKNATGGRDTVARVLEMEQINNSSWIPGFLKSNRRQDVPQKTILIVGVTGAGKSTLIDAIINFVLNVRYEDNHRFQLVNLSSDEKKKNKNQAISQTDNITIYKIPLIQGGNVPFALNIIDTPGER